MNLRPALVTLLLLGVCGHASAQPELSGSWRASPLRIRYAVSAWGPDCGPRPPAQTSESGGNVQVTQRGDDLTFSGAVRWTTNACASETPGLRRVSSSYQNGNWTTRCQTPTGHAHPERGVYRLTTREDGSLRYSETTNWNWALRTSTCVATRRGTRSFTRPESAAPPDTAMEETPTEPTPRCTAGPAARIALRPREANLEPGGRQCFRARVVDAAGCAVTGRRVDLHIDPSSQARGRMEGRCFVAAGTAAEAEGVAQVVASSQELRATARVRIAPTDLTGLRAQGGNGRQLTSGEAAEARGASGVSARVGEGGVPWFAIAGAAVVLLLIALGLALLLLKRRRKSRTETPYYEPEPPADESPAEVLAQVSEVAVAQVVASDNEGQENLICPKCRRGYPAGSRFCPNDSEALISYADFRARSDAQERERICPTCGSRYPAGTTFCGKDGTPL